MTVDLNMMLDLRDLQVAMDVAKRAEMGWFDVEFTMYGTCFERCGKRYFRVSADAARIYDFIETSAQKALLPTNVLTLTKTCPVPTGMREFIASDVKKMLAKALEAAYPQDFFRFLDETASWPPKIPPCPCSSQNVTKSQAASTNKSSAVFKSLSISPTMRAK